MEAGDVRAGSVGPSLAIVVGLILSGALPAGAAPETLRKKGIIAFEANESGNNDINLVNADGSGLVNVSNHPAFDFNPVLSPNGRWIVFSSDRDGPNRLFLMRRSSMEVIPLTQGPHGDSNASWSPDATTIAFLRVVHGNFEIFTVHRDGSDPTNLTKSPALDAQPNFSPDGTQIVFMRDYNIYVMNADGSGVTQITFDATDEWPHFSPDGQTIVFHRYLEGVPQIFSMKASGAEVTQLTFSGSNAWPVWSPNGLRIAYQSAGVIRTIDSDGTHRFEVTPEDLDSGFPSWGPGSL